MAFSIRVLTIYSYYVGVVGLFEMAVIAEKLFRVSWRVIVRAPPLPVMAIDLSVTKARMVRAETDEKPKSRKDKKT